VRLSLEYVLPSLGHSWFANAPNVASCFERLFSNAHDANGFGASGGIVIPYWMFPDYLKSKTFLSAVEIPWFTWRIIERRYEWNKPEKLAALLCLYAIAVGITVALWTALILVRSVPNPCGIL